MWRKPQVLAVVWGGLPPHLEHLRSPAVQDMIDNAPRRRDQYLADKERHVQIQENYEKGLQDNG